MIDVRLEAYKIIHKVLAKNVFSDKLLARMAKRLKAADSDANLLYMLVKGVIKMHHNLDYIARQYTEPKRFNNTPQKFKLLLYMGLYQLKYCDNIPDHAAINETVALAKKMFGNNIANFINATLRSYQRNPEITYPEDMGENLACRYSFDNHIITDWLDYWGEENTEKLCEYYNKVPRLNVRVNTLATDRKRLIDYFERRGILVEESTVSENMLVTDMVQEVLNDVAFQEGYFSIQDASAALVVELMQPKMNESILDLFAAPGGKATYISELMCNSGELIAVDKFPNKVKKIKQSMERLKINNANLHSSDAFTYGPVAPAFDRVLLDVPCSGWGVFQKKAELRWQLNQDVPKLIKLQENALKLGASFTKPGGFLIYSTCTLNKKENETQIEKFLARNKSFKLIPASKYIDKDFTENGYLKTLPFVHNMDGAFAAKMQKAE